MFKVTRELYHNEMADAVFKHLKDFLLTKEKNHCQRIEYLPSEVMRLICKKVREDKELQKRNVEAYVLSEKASAEYEIESGALIEKRNREKFGILVAFIPQGLRLPAEDSYDIQTFKTYDLGGVLKAHLQDMVNSFPEDQQERIKAVLQQPVLRKVPIEKHLKYLIALKHDGAGWEEAGAYLFLLNLIPDLELTKKGIETRIDRNARCVDRISNPEESILISIEALVNEYGLDPDVNNIREHLVEFLRERNVADSDAWLSEIFYNDTLRAKLTFDKWKFKDLTKPGQVEVHLDPLKDPQTGRLVRGIKEEGNNLVATTDPRNPIHLKWETFPKHPENLAYFVILVVRDTEDTAAGDELVRRTVKAGRQSLKLSLKDIELEEGETCAAKIIIHAKDKSGVMLAFDESEPFWIEGNTVIEEPSKKGSNIRNRAEAFLYTALRAHRLIEIDSEGWEEGAKRYYRIKLANRDIYRIEISRILYEIELKNMSDSANCGAWEADMRNRSVLESNDLKPVEVASDGIKSFAGFIKARKHLFHRFQDKDPTGVVETFDLCEFKEDILDYVASWQKMFDEIEDKLKSAKSDGQVNNILNDSYRINRIDTLHLRIGMTDDENEAILLAPTHPLRILWILQYQQLLMSWAAKLNGVADKDINQLINRESIEKIGSLNIPSSLTFGRDHIYENSDNVNLYWSAFPKGDTADIRKVVSILFRLLGQKGGGEITAITPYQLADKVWRYLKHHPYVTTLKINVINPGDGLLILNTIRELQNSGEFDDLNYDVALYGDLRYEVMGSAFDEMTEESSFIEGSQSEIDEVLLKPNKNPLFPKLTFSKTRVKESDWHEKKIREAHITVLIDRFSTKVLTRPAGLAIGSFCLHDLIAEYRSDFDIKGESATWSRKVIANKNKELSKDDHCAEQIYKASNSLLKINSCFYDWGNSLEKVPAIQLELSDVDKQIISKIHECSDWVLTIDRNFGIEYFDNPRSAPGVSVRSYLIDYSPEFIEGVGHRLIVSTFWLSEIEGLIKDGLCKMGIPSTGFHAAQILDVLKSISGKLALKLINNPNDARQIIGLALTRLHLERENILQNGVLIPVDSHIDLFIEHKRQLQDIDIRIHRSDLIFVYLSKGQMVFRLIEVKFRSGSGSPAEEFGLKEAIVVKNDDTQKVLESRFIPQEKDARLDREIQNKQLANLLYFYSQRCRRHGLIKDEEVAESLKKSIDDIGNGIVNIAFEKSGYIFNLNGTSKPPEIYKKNAIYVIGGETIRELLEIPEDSEAPVSPEMQPVETKADVVEVKEKKKTPKGKPVLKATTPKDAGKETPKMTMQTKVEKEKPVESAKGEAGQLRILLGQNCDTKKEVFWDPFTDKPKKLANQHLLIVGKSGAGKTQGACSFMLESSKNSVPFVVFDFQGEYMSPSLTNSSGKTFIECTDAKVLDAADGIDINPLEIPMDPHSSNKQNYMKVVYQVSTSLAKIFGLGDIQCAILRDGIAQAYAINGFIAGDRTTWNSTAPNLRQIWEILKHMETTQGGNVRNLNLRIQPLFETGVFVENGSYGFDQVLKQPTIIRLSNLATPELMIAVARFVLQKIYSVMLSQGPTDKLRLFAVVDEAHKLSYDETLTELIREARKYGVGILLASQSVKDFDRIVFDMVGTKISLQLEGEDARVMSENLGLLNKDERDQTRHIILHQPPHTALIRSNHFEPYIQANIVPFWKK